MDYGRKPEKAMATHSSTLAWKIPCMEEPGRLQSMGSLESDTTEWRHFHFSLSCIGEGNGNPLQCSCLENPRDGEAWWAAIYGVAQSRTRLKWLSSSSSSMAESKEELKRLLMKVKEESEKTDLKLSIQSHHFMSNRWRNNGNSDRYYYLGPQNHCRWWVQPWNLKTLAPWKKSYDQPSQHSKKQRH